jgi:hypothetical protein
MASYKSRFTEFFIQANGLGKNGFDEWLFLPGMLFLSPDKWWGNRSKRDHPHEGLDLGLYRDRQGNIRQLEEATQIPAMYGGVVVKVLDDFLGKSVIMEHVLPDNENIVLITIYGHTIPAENLNAGRSFNQGDIIATLANRKKSKPGIDPHLHISTAWRLRTGSYDNLNWNTIGTSDTLTLFDPLQVMDWHYSVLENDLYTG